jgi:type III pantothenate kinase
MFLALDIGNSAVKGGFFEGVELRHAFRQVLHRQDTEARWDEALSEAWTGRAVTAAGIASVVPDGTARLLSLLQRRMSGPITVVDPALPLPFRMGYHTPETLGRDRLAAAAATWVRYGSPARSVVALDAGTAVTYDVVARSGVFLGGAIGPGPALLQQALHRGTAQLPEVPLALPEEVVGRSTREALQSGILYGFLDSVDGMLRRIAGRLGEPPVVVATGGWAPLLHEHLDGITEVDPYLVLHGVRILSTRSW